MDDRQRAEEGAMGTDDMVAGALGTAADAITALQRSGCLDAAFSAAREPADDTQSLGVIVRFKPQRGPLASELADADAFEQASRLIRSIGTRRLPLSAARVLPSGLGEWADLELAEALARMDRGESLRRALPYLAALSAAINALWRQVEDGAFDGPSGGGEA